MNWKRKYRKSSSHLHPEWLQQWHDAYTEEYGVPPRVDIAAIHCYGQLEKCQPIFEQATEYCAEWLDCRGIWVTEFACLEDITEAQKVVEWLEANPAILRYFWFTSWVNYPTASGGVFWHVSIKNDGSEQWWGQTPITPALADFGTTNLTAYGEMYRDQ